MLYWIQTTRPLAGVNTAPRAAMVVQPDNWR